MTDTRPDGSSFTTLREGLPVPVDDGAADHLPGARVPDLELPTSDGGGSASPGWGRVAPSSTCIR
jgi:hypothetical protein